ncbi:AAA family ATPase CDC6 [Sugiyamaella lignohabitans]|uniref:Cell division control protein n=1 Tax=Sugiyamaella lignohabitans TaxID=796027 RepID=A0A167DN25_9ASCO|nr:AAA family ATPase CDC6 [Sugiyamaella lignohabitans]ANB13091.1 AAA family ATPase CDC6 [Sugiyamaella lignohabitans]
MTKLLNLESIRVGSGARDTVQPEVLSGNALVSPQISPAKRARREPIRKPIITASTTAELTESTSTGELAEDINETQEVVETDNAAEPRTPKRKRVINFPNTPQSSKKLKLSEIPGTSGLQTPPTTPTVYSLGKAVFQRGSNVTGIIGRDGEREKIQDFLKSRILGTGGKHNGALYLSGLPGTGKSALLSEVIEDLLRDNENEREFVPPRVASINCMIVDRPEMIYARILKDLMSDQNDDEVDENDEHEVDGDEEDTRLSNQIALHGVGKIISDLDKLFLTKGDRRCIVVLDELDHVVTKDQEVLFKIFQWAFINSSNLILIGIANALDLTDRFLPRLRSNGLTPELLAFAPYSASDIEQIIKKRLRSMLPEDSTDPLPLMQPAAIQLCSRKAAANTGDLRKAFDICRRAIEVAEEEVRRKFATIDEDEANLDTNDKKSNDQTKLPASWKRAIVNGHKSMALTSLSLQDAPKVTVAHIARVCTSAFGGSTSGRIKTMNLQQKAVLCVLVIAEASSPTTINNSMTVSKLFERYTAICDREKSMGRLHFNEYLEVISALEFSGVITVSGVCGRKGLGVTGRRRTSRGGGGASAGQSTLGSREEYGQRKISSNVHRVDLISAVSDIPLLKQFLEATL